MRPVLPRISSAASGYVSAASWMSRSNVSDSRERNCAEDQITISFPTATGDQHKWPPPTDIPAKSRSDTESSEFAVGRSKPSALAVASRSIGNDVPANAPAPRGLRPAALGHRQTAPGRDRTSPHRPANDANVTGCAACRWVKPGMTQSAWASA